MKIAGVIKNSFVDYPKNISTVVFTYGCNLDCWYCHNRDIIEEEGELTSEEKLFEFLEQRKGQIDGVVISGGEPTLQPDLKEFIKKIKDMGFLVKLDTNGTNPEILEDLLNEKLIDFVAMDVKTSLEKYNSYSRKNCKINEKNIEKSINLIKNSEIDYEFRTTFAPDVLISDIENITKMIAGAKSYAIQKFRPVSEKVVLIPHTISDYNTALEIAKKHIENSFLRGM